MAKVERFGDLAYEEQIGVIRELMIRVAQEQAFHEALAIAPTLIRMQDDIDRLNRAVIDMRAVIDAQNARAPVNVRPENPAQQLLRWTQGAVPVNEGANVTVNDIVIQPDVQAGWRVNRKP